MSVHAIAWAYQQNLKSGPKFLLVTLANYADDAYECWPSVNTLMRDSGMSNRGVIDNLFILEEKGLITRKIRGIHGGTGGRKSSVYTLNTTQSEKSSFWAPKVRILHTQSEESSHKPKDNRQYKYINKPQSKLTEREEWIREMWGLGND